MQRVVVVYRCLSGSGWWLVVTLCPQLLHWVISLGLLAVSLDNGNDTAWCSMVSTTQVSRTWRSVNMIQQLGDKHLLNIAISIFLEYMLQLILVITWNIQEPAQCCTKLRSPLQMLLDATSDTDPRVREMFTISGVTESSGWHWWYWKVVYKFAFALSEKKEHCENNIFLRSEDKSCLTKLNNRLADFFRRWPRLMAKHNYYA